VRATNHEVSKTLDDETRSLTAEIDYSKKDASRFIVQTNKLLRAKLLQNLEGVKKNKPLLQSEIGSVKTLRSRTSNVSARASQPGHANV